MVDFWWDIEDKVRATIKRNARNGVVAELCGCSASHISNVLNGRRYPSIRLQDRLMTVFSLCTFKEVSGVDYVLKELQRVASNRGHSDPVRVIRIGRVV